MSELTSAQQAKKRYIERNPEKVAQSKRAYYERNKEEVKARAKKWRKENNYQPPPNREANRRRNRKYWHKNHAEVLIRHANREAQRRAAKKGLANEAVDRMKLFEMFQGLCGICGGVLDKENFHLDHKTPLVAGGSHSYENTQPTHPFCNLSKGARLNAA